MAKKKTVKRSVTEPAKLPKKAANKSAPSGVVKAGAKTKPADVTLNAKLRRAGTDSAAAPKRVPSITRGTQKVDVAEAVRERLRLYPLAMDNEIAAMLELDGFAISSEKVARIRAEAAPKSVDLAGRQPRVSSQTRKRR